MSGRERNQNISDHLREQRRKIEDDAIQKRALAGVEVFRAQFSSHLLVRGGKTRTTAAIYHVARMPLVGSGSPESSGEHHIGTVAIHIPGELIGVEIAKIVYQDGHTIEQQLATAATIGFLLGQQRSLEGQEDGTNHCD